jgi:hypothetical protein
MSTALSPIKGVYRHLDCLMRGIDDLQKAGFNDMQVMSPLPRHEIEEKLYKGEPSPVRWFTLFGCLMGATLAFSLCSFTHANWPMIIPGGKPLVSVPPFLVITFEGNILWGSMMTLTGLILNCRLPGFNLPDAVKDGRFTDDCFGIVLENVGAGDGAQVKHILHHSGAFEVSGGDASHA